MANASETAEQAAQRLVLQTTKLVMNEVIQALARERDELNLRLAHEGPVGEFEKAIQAGANTPTPTPLEAPVPSPEAPVVSPEDVARLAALSRQRPTWPDPGVKAEPAKEPASAAAATEVWKAMMPKPPKTLPPWARTPANALLPAIRARFGALRGEVQAPIRSVDDVAAATADRLTQFLAGLMMKVVQHLTQEQGPPEQRPAMRPDMAMRMEPTGR
jgi:hypothetical protein